jgi:tetratricopeptide (TPR) repeat protein
MWRRVALDSRRRCCALPGTRAGSEERGRSRSGMQQLKGEAKAEAAASGCAICLEASPSDTLVLPCAHSFCRGCIDTLFCRHAEEGDYASRCPTCRAPLFGVADNSFGQAMEQMAGGAYDAAVERFAAARDAALPFATGPAGLNRLAAASQFNIGRAHERAGRYEPAALAYRAASSMYPPAHAVGASEALSNEGTMLFHLGRHAAAVALWEEAVALDPTDTLTQLNLGMQYLNSSDIGAAQSKVEQVIEQEPHNARAYNLRGVILQRLGRLEQARGAYAVALELDPQSPDAARNLDALNG